jgi:oxygen-independent coproporphyrinogen III oxidase
MMTAGVYVQVPFCQTKCTYCNFHTGVVSREWYEPYVAAVCEEIRTSSAGAEADTVYLGGGTPSLLEPAALEGIIDSLGDAFRLAPGAELTLEADPETITADKARAWLAAGFNRVSLGAQSFSDLELQSAGRMHRRDDTYRANDILRDAGFANISMDVIAGLPHQTRASWDASLKMLTGGRQTGVPVLPRPEHVSIYMLEIDEGSRLGREVLAGGGRYGANAVPPDDAIAEFYESACDGLAEAGYEHYEISNWALPGFRSRHNLKYWRREPYLGFGAGAHSFDGATRWANVHDSAGYMACIEKGASPREQIETVTPAQALEEEFFLGLRQLEGVDFARIESVCGANGLGERIASLWCRVEDLRQQGLVEVEGRRVRLARSRLTVSNEVFVALLG